MADLRKGYWVELLPGERTDGRLAITFIAKRTYSVPLDAPMIEPLEDEEQPEFLTEDRYDEGDAETAAPTLEQELQLEKVGVDVIVVGKAHAPDGKPTPQFVVTVRVGTRKRSIKILGPRKVIWVPSRKRKGELVPQLPRFSAPSPIKELTLSASHAYGGHSWVIFDPETLRIGREVNAVIDEERAEEQAKKAKANEVALLAAESDKKAADEQAFLDAKVGQVDGDDEKLRRGDGSFGYDKAGVRKHDGEWGARTSKAGTAIMDVDAFEVWAAEQAAKQETDEQAAARLMLEKHKGKRQNEAGEWLEIDDGVKVLDGETLAAELAKSAAEQQEMKGALAQASAKRRKEQVLQGDGTRVFDAATINAITDDERWDEDLGVELKDVDADAQAERLKEIEDRRKKVEEKLAEFPKLPCPTNPFGKGFLVSHVKQLIERLELPQIEDPAAPLTPKDLLQDYLQPERVPLPAGVSCYPRQARPRIDFAGDYPSDHVDWEAVQDEQKRALDLAKDEDVEALREMDKREVPALMNAKFYNSAWPTMQWPKLNGDEEVLLENLSPEGALYFKLPGKSLEAELDRGRGVERLDMELDTLVVEPASRVVTMVWRAHFELASWDEFGGYPHLVGWVLDLDVKDKRTHDWQEAAAAARNEGTAMMDISEIENADAYWRTISDERKAKEAAAMAAGAGVAALDIERMGLYRQQDDDAWVNEAAEGTLDEAAIEAKKKEEEEYVEAKMAAMKRLDDKEKAEDERREEVADAVKEGKEVPPPDAKKTPKQLKAKAAAKAKAAKGGGAKAKAAAGAKKAAPKPPASKPRPPKRRATKK